jgi:epoxyqueuosine reductase QueG
MTISAEEIKAFAIDEGVDIVGVGDVKNVPNSEPLRPPQRLLPSATSVIVFGTAMLDGILDSGNWYVGSGQALTLYQELARIGYRIGRKLEKEGYKAVMVGPSDPHEISPETKGLVGEVSHKHCGYAAGIGIIGRNRLLVTKQHGPRLNLATVVTDAPLTPDPIMETDFCSGCRSCIDACPINAISDDEVVDTRACLRHVTLYDGGKAIRYITKILDKPVEEQVRALRDLEFYKYYHHMNFGLSYNCISCALECPIGK